MGLFDKKYCDVCGEKIGLLGNRKLEDGNLCKECAREAVTPGSATAAASRWRGDKAAAGIQRRKTGKGGSVPHNPRPRREPEGAAGRGAPLVHRHPGRPGSGGGQSIF